MEFEDIGMHFVRAEYANQTAENPESIRKLNEVS
jgi:hypothetical protein